jgi:hypothetical protein
MLKGSYTWNPCFNEVKSYLRHTAMPVSNAVPWLWEASVLVLLAPIFGGIVARYAAGGVQP